MTRAHRALGVAVSICFLLAGCGIPLDDDPTIIAVEELPQVLQPGTSTTSTTIPGQLTEAVTIFLVDPGDGEARLVPVERQVRVVEGGTEVAEVILEQLLAGATSEEQLEGNLTSAIVPSSDTPISVVSLQRPSERQLVVVLSEAPAIEGSDRTVAFAQLVFTLTELSNVDEVRFAVRSDAGDEDISVSTDTGEGDVRRAVDRTDFPSFEIPFGPGGG